MIKWSIFFFKNLLDGKNFKCSLLEDETGFDIMIMQQKHEANTFLQFHSDSHKI